jgi:hypothetical protein
MRFDRFGSARSRKNLVFLFLLWFWGGGLKQESHYIDQVGLEVKILLLQPPECLGLQAYTTIPG